MNEVETEFNIKFTIDEILEIKNTNDVKIY